jgi:hypothetical protein
VRAQFVVANLIEVNSYPAFSSHIGWSVVDRRAACNQSLLLAWPRRDYHRDVAIVVVIVREHGEDPFFDEKRRFTMRKFLRDSGQRQADGTDSFYLFVVIHGR